MTLLLHASRVFTPVTVSSHHPTTVHGTETDHATPITSFIPHGSNPSYIQTHRSPQPSLPAHPATQHVQLHLCRQWRQWRSRLHRGRAQRMEAPCSLQSTRQRRRFQGPLRRQLPLRQNQVPIEPRETPGFQILPLHHMSEDPR